MDISLEIHCDRCGSANLSFGGGDGERIRCNDCGAGHSTLGELKGELAELLLAKSAEALRRGLETPSGS